MGPIARAGKKLSAPTSSAVPVSNTPKVTPSEGIVPGLGGRRVCRKAASQRQSQHGQDVSARQHRDYGCRVVENIVSAETCHRLTVVGKGTGVSEKNFGEAVRAGIRC